jgi:hypothetical protein
LPIAKLSAAARIAGKEFSRAILGGATRFRHGPKRLR